MPIPQEHAHRGLYHFTHLDNLPRLLQTGFLANNHPNFPRNAHRSIAEQNIQSRRAHMVVPCGPGGVVHDYVPLYFGSLSPMLLSVINRKNIDQQEIIYFEFPISLLDGNGVIFTDASANTTVPPNFYSNSDDLDKLKWGEIDSKKWSSANETLRHQRMAEALVHLSLPLQLAECVVVWNKNIKQTLQSYVADAGVDFPPIRYEDSYNRPHYFTKFMDGKPDVSLVTGPKLIAAKLDKAIGKIEQKIGCNPNAPFESVAELLEALRCDFGCLSHTLELVELKSANGIHKKTVDIHTQDVVAKLRSLPEFDELDARYKILVELAAYLHDIGKGPKSRWNRYNGVQQVDPDHPVSAVPMLVEILTISLKTVNLEDARILLKLVLYHDLVGDVLGRQRDEQQIVDVADNQLELDLLFAIGKADATSLVEQWWNDDAATDLYERCLIAI